MKIIILSLLAILLIICVLYYEHSQIIKKIDQVKTEAFNVDEELFEPSVQEQIDTMNNGGNNTVSSNICNRTSDISSVPKNIISFNMLFSKLNYAFDAMFANFETYRQYKEASNK